MSILHSVSDAQKITLKSAQQGECPTAGRPQTIQSLVKAGLIEAVEHGSPCFRLTPTGELLFITEAQRHNQPSNFAVGETVDFLQWRVDRNGVFTVRVIPAKVVSTGKVMLRLEGEGLEQATCRADKVRKQPKPEAVSTPVPLPASPTLPPDPRVIRSDDGKLVQVQRPSSPAVVPEQAPGGAALIQQARDGQDHPVAKLLNHRETRIEELDSALNKQRIRTELFRRAARFYHCMLRVATQVNDDLYTRVGELETRLVAALNLLDEKQRLSDSLDAMQERLDQIGKLEVYVVEMKLREDWRAARGLPFVHEGCYISESDPENEDWAICNRGGRTERVFTCAYISHWDASNNIPTGKKFDPFDFRIRHYITGEVIYLRQGKPAPQPEVVTP